MGAGFPRDLDALLPEGTDPPTHVPAAVFDAALQAFLDQRRVDMRSLAVQLEIGRATLYRRVGSRELLLGQVLWFLTRRTLVRAARAGDGLGGTGRIVAVCTAFLTDANTQPSLRRFLAAEPETALRVLTSKSGAVQPGVIGHLERLIRQEVDAGLYAPRLDPHTLAFVLVRIGEGFLYADVIADVDPDVGQAVEVMARLLDG